MPQVLCDVVANSNDSNDPNVPNDSNDSNVPNDSNDSNVSGAGVYQRGSD